MQHPASLALLGAACAFSTASAAGSLPRGVGPECELSPSPIHPWDNIQLTIPFSRIFLQKQGNLPMHFQSSYQTLRLPSQRQLLRLP